MNLLTLITNKSSIEKSTIGITFQDLTYEEYALCSDENGWFFMANGRRYDNTKMFDQEIVGIEFNITHNLDLL